MPRLRDIAELIHQNSPVAPGALPAAWCSLAEPTELAPSPPPSPDWRLPMELPPPPPPGSWPLGNLAAAAEAAPAASGPAQVAQPAAAQPAAPAAAAPAAQPPPQNVYVPPPLFSELVAAERPASPTAAAAETAEEPATPAAAAPSGGADMRMAAAHQQQAAEPGDRAAPGGPAADAGAAAQPGAAASQSPNCPADGGSHGHMPLLAEVTPGGRGRGRAGRGGRKGNKAPLKNLPPGRGKGKKSLGELSGMALLQAFVKLRAYQKLPSFAACPVVWEHNCA